jgi:hypothetical protein
MNMHVCLYVRYLSASQVASPSTFTFSVVARVSATAAPGDSATFDTVGAWATLLGSDLARARVYSEPANSTAIVLAVSVPSVAVSFVSDSSALNANAGVPVAAPATVAATLGTSLQLSVQVDVVAGSVASLDLVRAWARTNTHTTAHAHTHLHAHTHTHLHASQRTSAHTHTHTHALKQTLRSRWR